MLLTLQLSKLSNPFRRLKDWIPIWTAHFCFTILTDFISYCQIARSIFADFMTNEEVFEAFFNDLWHQFGSSKAYHLQPHALDLFKSLKTIRTRNQRGREFLFPVVGVLTNSDPRVSNILTSLGIQVAETGDKKHNKQGVKVEQEAAASSMKPQHGIEIDYDIDFIITSYDAGVEKPAPAIFEVAYQKGRSFVPDSLNHGHLQSMHIGDDVKEDYQGAKEARWRGILVNSQPLQDPQSGLISVSGLEGVEMLLKHLYLKTDLTSKSTC